MSISDSEIYREQYAHFRSMNEILYKIPPLFTAVIGGLWYFAVIELDKAHWISAAIFLFAAIASVAFVNVMQRFRMAFKAYINNLNKFDGHWKVSISSSTGLPSTAVTIQYLLWAAAILSVAGIGYAACHGTTSSVAAAAPVVTP
jgi:hypothetical protein